MDKIVNGVMRSLEYLKVREYLSRMIYQPEDIQKEFNKEKQRINDMFENTESQIKNRIRLIKTLEKLVESDHITTKDTVIN